MSATAISVPSTGATLTGYEVGSGARGVVLVPELGRLGLCGWWPYAAYLAGKGYHVLLFDHRCAGDSSCSSAQDPNELMDDITAVTQRLQQDGARRTVLIGASQGGSEVVIAGTRPPAGVVGVVALSADELKEELAASPYPTSATAAAPKLKLPALFAVAAGDSYVSVVDIQKLKAAAPAQNKRIVVLPAGSGHGWDLLAPAPDGTRPPPDGDILGFLNEVLS